MESQKKFPTISDEKMKPDLVTNFLAAAASSAAGMSIIRRKFMFFLQRKSKEVYFLKIYEENQKFGTLRGYIECTVNFTAI